MVLKIPHRPWTRPALPALPEWDSQAPKRLRRRTVLIGVVGACFVNDYRWVGRKGLEPLTYGLKARSSTD